MVNQVEQFMSGQDPGNVAVSLKIGTSLTYEKHTTGAYKLDHTESPTPSPIERASGVISRTVTEEEETVDSESERTTAVVLRDEVSILVSEGDAPVAKKNTNWLKKNFLNVLNAHAKNKKPNPAKGKSLISASLPTINSTEENPQTSTRDSNSFKKHCTES